MSKSEKRYFKLFARRHAHSKTTKYVDLFDVLAAQPAAESRGPQKKSGRSETEAGETTLNHIKNLPSAKHYLHGLVMRSLRAFHAGKTTEKRLREGIGDAELLIARGLLRQAEDLLKQLYTPAAQREEFLVMLHITKLRREMISSNADINADIAALFAREREVMQQLLNVQKYQELSAKVFRIIREFGQADDPETRTRMRRLQQDQLLRDPSAAWSLTAQLFYYSIKAAIAYFESNQQELYDFCKRHADVCRSFFEAGGLPAEKYADSLHNYLHACLDNERYDEMTLGLQQLKALDLQDELAQSRSLITQYSLWCVILLKRGDSVELRNYVNDFDANYPKLLAAMNPEQHWIISLRIAMILFKLGDFSATLDRLRPIIHGPRDAPRHDIRHHAELLRLIAHYMLGDITFVEDSISALRRRTKLSGQPMSEFLLRTLQELLRADPTQLKTITRRASVSLENMLDSDQRQEQSNLLSNVMILWFDQLMIRASD